MINKTKWGVVIVTYKPEMIQFNEKIKAISEITSNLVIVNNGPGINMSYSNLINLDRNMGIAYAQNRGAGYLRKKGVDLIFFFDQDSEIPSFFFNDMLMEWTKIGQNDTLIGALSPAVIDKNLNSTQAVLKFEKSKIIKVRWSREKEVIKDTFPISSGMLVSSEAFFKVRGLTDKLFIDYVDYEFNLKLMQSGYNIYSTNAANIYHAIGVKKERRLLTKKIYPYNYPLFREYYFVRNSIYVLLKFRKSFKGITRLILKGILIRIIFIGYEEKKIDRIKIMIKGFLDGFRLFKNEIDNVR